MNLLKSNLWPVSIGKIKPKINSLYYLGKYNPSLFSKAITVVGSRKMTQYGMRIIERLIPPLIEQGVVIISGFMYGVDQASHQICLDFGGQTVAVLGWGIDYPVSSSEQKLFNEVQANGLVLSEYPNKTKPQLWMFPARNRIMAALAKAVLVIEAAPNSGSLITADYAKKYKKKLLAVPGPITSNVSLGTNELIKTGMAQMVTSTNDIFRALDMSLTPLGCYSPSDSSSPITKLLMSEALTLDEIKLKIDWPVDKISSELSILELQGQIKEINDRYYLNSLNAS